MPIHLSQYKPRNLRASLLALLLGTALGAGGACWAISAQASEGPAAPPLGLPPVAAPGGFAQSGFAPLVKEVSPAVVQITTTSMPSNKTLQQMPGLPPGWPFGDFFGQQFGGQGQHWTLQEPAQHALGSGFLIDPAGYIVTNNHVVDGAHHISVTLTDGDKYAAKVIGRDPKTDLALLKIDAGKPLPYVAFGDSGKEQVGDWVVAVGNPYGLGGTVTAGIVSARGRNINDGSYDDFLQIDAPINPGNSGGPLFNQSGRVVGIDTAIYSPSGGSVGIGFAIPSNLAKDIVAQLRAHGKVARGWLGIQMQALTPALAKAVGLSNDHGVLVDMVEKDSPALRAGIKQGDVITAYDGKPIKSMRDLAFDVADTAAGKTADVTLWRNQQRQSIDVTIGNQKQEKVASAQGAGTHKGPVGMALERLTPGERNELNVDPSVNGVVVAQVTPDSKADQSGVQAGDIILRVAGNKVANPAQAAHDIHAAENAKKPAVLIQILRDGVKSYLGLKLATG
ncbi:MAG: Do family serine endopeptidase [Alphaproteobacteria bacterium]|nr:Do family serine endopeptidase [Alphaproteobacteria bacterium]